MKEKLYFNKKSFEDGMFFCKTYLKVNGRKVMCKLRL